MTGHGVACDECVTRGRKVARLSESMGHIFLYDCTLRDGAQTQGVDFTVADKIALACELDSLGVDYVEGGWPGANLTDDAFFHHSSLELARARLVAFGMTRRSGYSAVDDPGLAVLLCSGARVVTLVGKTWDFQVHVALGIDLNENLRMIHDSVTYAGGLVDEVMFDAEHFFDGFRANPDYAVACLRTAYGAGARWVVLCDTNGGSLPFDIEAVVEQVVTHVPGSHLGIHCHNDTDNAVANSLAAIRAGVCQVQGTLNGLGERCGNANLTSIIPNLILKMGYQTSVSTTNLTRLVHVSRALDKRLNQAPRRNAPYVGEAAFAHKGGLHASAVEKDPRCYEHIMPEQVGNDRQILVSNQAGRASILARFRRIGLEFDPNDARVGRLIEEVKSREYQGYTYDGADASFELLARRSLEGVREFFQLQSFRVIDERRLTSVGSIETITEATIKAAIGSVIVMTVAEGNGPVHALDSALRKALAPLYPQIDDLKLVDYKVRILTPEATTAAVTRVIIESGDSYGHRWGTVGVSTNVIEASYHALNDSLTYKLLCNPSKSHPRAAPLTES
ncbi:(R)-citramalate synthase [invertebrate metagenome]|uniref:(R)-citramalate synthase n=1 Tax=invertebrate metagenome TaxID=1711999 RepID=A0A484H7A5_9ZZZZ